MTDWTGMITMATISDGRAVWETLSQAEARDPIVPVPVSARQLAILQFLIEWQRTKLGMPSYAEIGAAAGLTARSAVQYQLEMLESKGLIQRARGRSGAIRLNTSTYCC